MNDSTAVHELSQVKYIGQARARELTDSYGIDTIAELVEAAESGKLTEIKGIGSARSDKILASARELLDEKISSSSSSSKSSKENATKESSKRSESKQAKQTSSKKSATTSAEKTAEKGKPETAKRSSRPIDRFLERLRCPACGHSNLDRGPATLTCRDCQREYNFYNGVADLAPPHPTGRNLTQRLMDSRLYSQFYEDVMRPRLTAVVSERTMQEEYELSTEYLELESDSTVLDVACGTANFTRYFAEQLHQSEDGGRDSLVAGMDISWSMLEKARTLLTQQGLDQEVYLIRGDATRIPVQRAAYNRLHCAGALHMVNNIDEALRNFSRVLEPGGICVIGTFLLGDGMVRRFLKKAAEIPSKFHWFSEQELYKRLDRAGFEVADSSVAGDAITVKARRVK